jgi:hypothetical protein
MIVSAALPRIPETVTTPAPKPAFPLCPLSPLWLRFFTSAIYPHSPGTRTRIVCGTLRNFSSNSSSQA